MTKLAAQLYTVREYTKTEEDFEATLKKLSEIGYEAVQVSAIGPIAPERVADISQKYNMTICATHVPLSRIVDDTDALIEEHKLYGCHYIGLGAMPQEGRENLTAMREMLGKLRDAAKKIKEAGLQFVYHNHAFEFQKVEDNMNLFDVMEEVDPEGYIGLLMDTYWVQFGGADPAEFIDKYARRIEVIHLKDMQVIEGKPTMAEIGVGNMNFKRIIDHAEKIGAVWYPVEQDVCLRNPFESLEISYKYCKEVLGIQ